MRIMIPLIAVILLISIALLGSSVAGMKIIFTVIFPYAALATFLVGVIYRVMSWAKSPVPFRITTTSGQQKSLPWIKSNPLDNPYSTLQVLGRMALEVLFFRSLFRNTKSELKAGPKLVYGDAKYLWIGALAFHWTFLIIILRHLKFFSEPVPGFVRMIESLDAFFQVGIPVIFATDVIFLAAVFFLFLRRIWDNKIRYISLPADYFPLFMLMSIGITGVLMRYFMKVDLVSIKEMAVGLLSFSPVYNPGIDSLFIIHFFLVTVLIAYLPFSKLMHMGGVFLSPTRNLANNNRAKRHINPWDYPVKVHTYEEWEDEFRDVMKAADMPLEKE